MNKVVQLYNSLLHPRLSYMLRLHLPGKWHHVFCTIV